MDEAPLAVLSRTESEYRALQGFASHALWYLYFVLCILFLYWPVKRNLHICRHRCSARSALVDDAECTPQGTRLARTQVKAQAMGPSTTSRPVRYSREHARGSAGGSFASTRNLAGPACIWTTRQPETENIGIVRSCFGNEDQRRS